MDWAGVWAPKTLSQARLGPLQTESGLGPWALQHIHQEEEGLQTIKSNPPNWEPSCCQVPRPDGKGMLSILSSFSPCSAHTLLIATAKGFNTVQLSKNTPHVQYVPNTP